jgi:hypothetical protein
MKFVLLLSIAAATSAIATDVEAGLTSLDNITDTQLQKLRTEAGNDNCQYAVGFIHSTRVHIIVPIFP